MSFKMDGVCFRMIVGNVLKRVGVVEGGTGVMAKQYKIQRNFVTEHESIVEKEAVHK